MYAGLVTSWVWLGSWRWPFSVLRAWFAARHFLALDFHALAPFDTTPHPPRWSRPGDLQLRGCGPGVSPHIFLHFFALYTPESLLRLPTSNMTILPAKQAACDLCGLHGSVMQRLPLENWSVIVLLKTWWWGYSRADIYIYLCLFVFTLVLLHMKWHMRSNSWHLF